MTHPIDRLATIRAEIRRLRKEQRQIKSQLLNGDIAPRGEHHVARVYKSVIVTPLDRTPATPQVESLLDQLRSESTWEYP